MPNTACQIMSSFDVERSSSNQPKKLRFITNHGAPHPKRRRVTAACLTCRRRKIACSGEQPTCDTCKQNRVDCAGYSSVVKSEGTTSPSEVRSVTALDTRTDDVVPNTSRRLSEYENQNGKAAKARDITNKSPPPSTEKRDSRPLVNGDEHDAAGNIGQTLFAGPRTRMPYFRWLGPTSIAPGLKQMVVKVKRRDTSAHTSDEPAVSPSLSNILQDPHRSATFYSTTPRPVESDIRTPLSLPFYDTSSMPPSELITHLCETFFLHLGCNFPFLQKARFLQDLEEKQVDAILVDAVCAMAARFSTHSLLTQQVSDDTRPIPSEYGQAFAQRAKVALIETYAMPSVAAVQAALLLAYNEFGESRDSGLWMYLGISIRLAQDLGLQKIEGLRYEGRDGPNPKAVKMEREEPAPNRYRAMDNGVPGTQPAADEDIEERRAVERERVDTFWSVFFLDRVVSSGTGRRSTLRDNDIELSFPALECQSNEAGWPTPFPALIRIVHLYGRVTDLLNSIKEPSDITNETSRKLADMETRVTSFYQGLSPRLHFEAMNFHHYVKAGEGTNFVLLHFWFHTLIVLLHQPTLLKTFEGKPLQLFPNSQQLSMSSAKTIADILSYSQLIDAKASLGNPFTTQPIYIAACAFLKETADRTATSAHHSRSQSRAGSRAPSPGRSYDKTNIGLDSAGKAPLSKTAPTNSLSSNHTTSETMTGRSTTKHTLLATAASQHYQLCYRALESIETYWAGTKYIITVLDQKFKGIGDPLLYTDEEGQCSLEQPRPEPTFTSPGWRRKFSPPPRVLVNQDSLRAFMPNESIAQTPRSTAGDHSQAIGWTLTGTLNSPNTNLAWHYPNMGQLDHTESPLEGQVSDETRVPNHLTSSAQPDPHSTVLRTASESSLPIPHHMSTFPHERHFSLDATSSLQQPSLHVTMPTTLPPNAPFPHSVDHIRSSDFPNFYGMIHDQYMGVHGTSAATATATAPYSDMLIESQDVDMSLLGLDMLPWLDAPLGDMMPLFEGEDGE